MKIDAYFTPFFPEQENQFKDHFIVMIDVLRASTTICAALFNGAKEIIPFDELQKALAVYSNLSRDNRIMGGERKGIKPEGFDAGNSPFEYSPDVVKNKTIIFTTTNGTKTFTKGKEAAKRVIGSFVNHKVVLEELNSYIESKSSTEEEIKVTFFCAGNEGRQSYEDVCCAGAFISHIVDHYTTVELTDAADAAKNLFNLHSDDLSSFLKTRSHASYLQKIGFEEDLDLAFKFNVYPVVPVMDGNSIKLEK